MIFINLPVQDLAAARRFYEGLGFRTQEHSSDERTAAMVVSDDIVVTLMTGDRFADLGVGEAGRPSGVTTVVHSLTVERRAEVDELVGRVTAAGGTVLTPPREGDSRYAGSFADPDGHAWEVLWLDQLHVVN